MFSIIRVPNPRCVGGVVVGPPDSVQRKLSRQREAHGRARPSPKVSTGYRLNSRARAPMDGVPWFITCCFIDRRHYQVRGGLMDHVADARDTAQRALRYLAVKPSPP
jgi:hypothetical protein